MNGAFVYQILQDILNAVIQRIRLQHGEYDAQSSAAMKPGCSLVETVAPLLNGVMQHCLA